MRLDVKNPSLSCIGGVGGTGSCRHSPHRVGSSGDININAYTASIKVLSQEQTDRLQCTGLSQNEHICPSKKSFSRQLVCSWFYLCFWEGIQDNSVHHGSEGIWIYPVPTPLSTNKHTVWCTGEIFGDETNRTWFYSTLIFFKWKRDFFFVPYILIMVSPALTPPSPSTPPPFCLWLENECPSKG